ncbi:MAG: heat-shock protein [Rubrivivax sp. SCN 70-15]|nr:MAG: heat-shock protein [Rubrivivax sp. SCN 70-15]
MNTVTQVKDKEPSAVARNEPALLPPVDVIEDASGITLYADLPGVSRDQLTLRVEGDQLSLEAALVLPVPKDMQATHAEVNLSQYRRAFTLSKELDADQVSAEMSQGVLRVRIPKAAHAQPRKIAVQVG